MRQQSVIFQLNLRKEMQCYRVKDDILSLIFSINKQNNFKYYYAFCE